MRMLILLAVLSALVSTGCGGRVSSSAAQASSPAPRTFGAYMLYNGEYSPLHRRNVGYLAKDMNTAETVPSPSVLLVHLEPGWNISGRVLVKATPGKTEVVWPSYSIETALVPRNDLGKDWYEIRPNEAFRQGLHYYLGFPSGLDQIQYVFRFH